MTKVDFCKVVRLIADKLMEAKRTSPSDILQAAIIPSNRFPGLRGNIGIPHVLVTTRVLISFILFIFNYLQFIDYLI